MKAPTMNKPMTEDEYFQWETVYEKSGMIYEFLVDNLSDFQTIWNILITLPALFCSYNNINFQRFIDDCQAHLEDMKKSKEGKN